MPSARYTGGQSEPDLIGGEGAIARIGRGQASLGDYVQALMMLVPAVAGVRASGFRLPGPYGKALRAEPDILPGIRQGVTPGGGDEIPEALYKVRQEALRGDSLKPGRVKKIGPLVGDVNIQRARLDMPPDPLHPELMDPTPPEDLIGRLLQGLRWSSTQ